MTRQASECLSSESEERVQQREEWRVNTLAAGMQPVCLFISLELSLWSHRAPPGSPDLTRSPANIPAIPGTTTRLESCDFLVPLLPEVDVFPVLFLFFSSLPPPSLTCAVAQLISSADLSAHHRSTSPFWPPLSQEDLHIR